MQLHLRRIDGRCWDIERDIRINHSFAAALWSRGETKRARALLDCSREITVDTLRLPDGSECEQIVSRQACRQRACLICSRVTAWKRRRKLHQVIGEYFQKPQGTHPVLIVLTRPAVPYTELRSEFTEAHAALRKFLRARKFERAFGSFARTTEFNFNRERGTCNVHFNLLAMAAPHYFADPDIYLDQRRDLAPLWSRCCGTADKRIVWIEEIRHGDEDGLRHAVFETCKYITKQYAFVAQDARGRITVDPDPFVTITQAMHGVRFFALGGLFRLLHADIAKREADMGNVSFAERLGATPVCTTRWQWSSRHHRFIRAAT
jgi:hypothetical protein